MAEQHDDRLLEVNLRGQRSILLDLWKPATLSLCRARPTTQRRLRDLYDIKWILVKGHKRNIAQGQFRMDGNDVVIKKIGHRHHDLVHLPAHEGADNPHVWPIIFEAAVLEHLNRPQSSLMPGLKVPKLLATYTSSGNAYIVMETIPGAVNLSAYVRAARRTNGGRGFSEDMAKYIFLSLYALLHALTRKEGVYHGNVNSTNVVISLQDFSIKLVDFNHADHYQSNYLYKAVEQVDELLLLPPEARVGNKEFQADPATTFALGMLLFSMVCEEGECPHDSWDNYLNGICNRPKGVSPMCQEVITACLATEGHRVAFDDLLLMEWCIPGVNLDTQKIHKEFIDITTTLVINTSN